MRFFFLFILFLIVPIKVESQDIPTPESDNFQALLDKTPIQSPQFPVLLLQQQRDLYKKESWDKFFANAIFYRIRVLPKQLENRSPNDQILIALEMMALAKHCLYSQASLIGAVSLAWFKEKNTATDKIEEALELVDLHSTFPAQAKPKAYSKTPRNSFTSEFYWPFEKQHLSLLSHPSIFRVVVKPQCQE